MFRLLSITALLLLPPATRAADALECAALTNGGVAHATGDLFAIGQITPYAVATNGSDELEAGIVYCLSDGGACLGDVDNNGQVDLSDLAAILSAFGACDGEPDYNPAADLTGDNCITLSDLATILAIFGETC